MISGIWQIESITRRETVDLPDDATVAHLREVVAQATGADASDLRYLGRPLEDTRTLAQAGLKANRTVVCFATYSMDEVAKHRTASDCWTVIRGQVYNLTDFVAEHPGGDIILDAAGRDGTKSFEDQAGQGSHTEFARTTMRRYQIGTLAV